jgi:hypothetical protein
MMILVLYFALLFTYVTRSIGSALPSWSNMALMLSIAVVFTPLTLAVLYRLLDRPGPVRDWIVGLSWSLLRPALAIQGNVFTTLFLLGSQRTRHYIVATASIVVNLCLIRWLVFTLPAVLPSCCPRCGRKSLIPARTPRIGAPPTHRTHWCASCGSRYRRTGSGIWGDNVTSGENAPEILR